MLGPFKEKYLKAAVKEIETLEEMGAWEVVDREEGMNVIDSFWVLGLLKVQGQILCLW